MDLDSKDLALLIRDKYHGERTPDLQDDIERLLSGEPLAYVIGWVPFLGLSLRLDSHPLIPRPETEWWTEVLIEHANKRFTTGNFSLLDLCAGSGAIGLSVLSGCERATVACAELSPLHSALISMNADENRLDRNRLTVRSGDLFSSFATDRFDIIATNPPYIPHTRELEDSVTRFEPLDALYAGEDGLNLIRRIVKEAPNHLNKDGELWMECDTSNIEEAARLMEEAGFRDVLIRTDLYSRPRVCVGYFS